MTSLNGSADWRLQIPENRRRHLRAWLLSGAILTFLILVVGGITRLTESGLSMVDWKPFVGVVPPIGHRAWQEAFEQYQRFPEYQKLRPNMTLGEFQFIFFWEYTHRLLARTIGLVFLIPFVYFAVRGYFNRPLALRALALFGLGALQGFVGWFMVSSGLVDDPRVSHYRLAMHLFMALSVFGLCLWLRHELRVAPGVRDASPGRGVYAVGALLLLQVLWGAFVAGLDAGLYYNTFPLMGGRLVPPGGLALHPAPLNLVANPMTVQWVHRALGTLLLVVAVAVAARLRGSEDRESARFSALFAGMVTVQYALGIATLLLLVPVSLGVLHQAFAVALFAVWITWLHRVRRGSPAPVRRAAVRLAEDAQPGSFSTAIG